MRIGAPASASIYYETIQVESVNATLSSSNSSVSSTTSTTSKSSSTSSTSPSLALTSTSTEPASTLYYTVELVNASSTSESSSIASSSSPTSTTYETIQVVNASSASVPSSQTTEPASCSLVPSDSPIPAGCYSSWVWTSISGDATDYTLYPITQSAIVTYETDVYTDAESTWTVTADDTIPTHTVYNPGECALYGVNCAPTPTLDSSQVAAQSSLSAQCAANGTNPTNSWSYQYFTYTSSAGLVTYVSNVETSSLATWTYSLSEESTTYTTTEYDPSYYLTTSISHGPSTFTTTYVETRSYPIYGCCGGCQLNFQRVEIYYFLPPNASAPTSSSAVPSSSSQIPSSITSQASPEARGLQPRYHSVLGSIAVINGNTL